MNHKEQRKEYRDKIATIIDDIVVTKKSAIKSMVEEISRIIDNIGTPVDTEPDTKRVNVYELTYGDTYFDDIKDELVYVSYNSATEEIFLDFFATGRMDFDDMTFDDKMKVVNLLQDTEYLKEL